MTAHQLTSDPEQCCFCADMTRDDQTPELSKEGFFNKLCRHSPHFGAFPSLSPLSTGHCLVVPRYHITSMAQVRAAHVDECLRFLSEVVDEVERSLGDCVIFEHGVGAGKHGGCGVTHAHVHVLPMQAAAMCHARQRIMNDYCSQVLDDIRQLFNIRPVSSYVLFGVMTGPLQLLFDDGVPSQYLRRLIADERNLRQWDWREYYGWEAYEDTRHILLNSAH